jgi:hypothetical protein
VSNNECFATDKATGSGEGEEERTVEGGGGGANKVSRRPVRYDDS